MHQTTPPMGSPDTAGLTAGPAPADASPPPLRMRIRASRIVAWLGAVFAVLLLLHLVVVSSYLDGWRFPGRDRFYFDAENNLPTFFSTFLLLVAAGLLGWIAAAKRAAADRFRTHWTWLAVVFLALAVDEAASFHELLIRPLRSAFDLDGLLWFGWVIAGAVFVAVFAVAYLRFLFHLAARFRRLFLACAVLYVSGALGLEMIGGQVFLAGQPQGELLPYMVAMTLEESLEMAGVLLFIHALLAYLPGCSRQLLLEVPRPGWSRDPAVAGSAAAPKAADGTGLPRQEAERCEPLLPGAGPLNPAA